jgi:hypothetical protein
VEEALVEMYLAGVSVRRLEDSTAALWGAWGILKRSWASVRLLGFYHSEKACGIVVENVALLFDAQKRSCFYRLDPSCYCFRP